MVNPSATKRSPAGANLVLVKLIPELGRRDDRLSFSLPSVLPVHQSRTLNPIVPLIVEHRAWNEAKYHERLAFIEIVVSTVLERRCPLFRSKNQTYGWTFSNVHAIMASAIRLGFSGCRPWKNSQPAIASQFDTYVNFLWIFRPIPAILIEISTKLWLSKL